MHGVWVGRNLQETYLLIFFPKNAFEFTNESTKSYQKFVERVYESALKDEVDNICGNVDEEGKVGNDDVEHEGRSGFCNFCI